MLGQHERHQGLKIGFANRLAGLNAFERVISSEQLGEHALHTLAICVSGETRKAAPLLARPAGARIYEVRK